jgi:tetratricopeptide (TPR) repeat protein
MSVNYDPKDHKSVEASFRRSLELNPNEPEVYINLGIVLYDCGKLEDAIAQCQQALNLITRLLLPNFKKPFALTLT